MDSHIPRRAIGAMHICRESEAAPPQPCNLQAFSVPKAHPPAYATTVPYQPDAAATLPS